MKIIKRNGAEVVFDKEKIAAAVRNANQVVQEDLRLKEEQIDQLFKGGYSSADSTDSHRGMGIGLSICKTIINAHGGQIWAGNHENGAVFTFTLPKEE